MPQLSRPAPRRAPLAASSPAAAASIRLGGLDPAARWRCRGSLWFANETNAGKFFDRLPHVFDFFIDLTPRDWFDPVRALFDLPSPYDDGSLKYNYPDGRVYLAGELLHPRIFLQDAGDDEHRAVLDADRLHSSASCSASLRPRNI